MSTWPANRLSNLVIVIAGAPSGDTGWPYSGPRRRDRSNDRTHRSVPITGALVTGRRTTERWVPRNPFAVSARNQQQKFAPEFALSRQDPRFSWSSTCAALSAVSAI